MGKSERKSDYPKMYSGVPLRRASGNSWEKQMELCKMHV